MSIASLRDMARREFKRSEAGHKQVRSTPFLIFLFDVLTSIVSLSLSLSFHQEFLQDLLDLEDPEVTKDAKLAVVDRMWRSWGMRLEWVSK